MITVRPPDRTPQDSDREKLTEAAGIIAGLLADDPTPQDARAAARAWLRRWECVGGRPNLGLAVCS